MDRNLGATNADATKSIQSWEASRGFYYQFGRSIPYYLNGSCLDPNVEDPTNAVPDCNGANKTSSYKPDNAKPSRTFPGIITMHNVLIKATAIVIARRIREKQRYLNSVLQQMNTIVEIGLPIIM